MGFIRDTILAAVKTHRSSVRGLVALLLTAACNRTGQGDQRVASESPVLPSPSACSLAVGESRPLTLRDGRLAFVGANSAAANRGAILAAATPAYTFRDGYGINTDTLVGVIVDSSGVGVPVLNPLPGRVAADLRVSSAGEAGWHVVFIDAYGQTGFGQDSGAVWYGRFDGTQWRGVERIAVIHYGSLSLDLAPDLGADGDQLRFAFAFERPFASDGTANRGIIMLRRDGGRWSADTLRLLNKPYYVRLVKAPTERGWYVGFDRGYSDAGRVRGTSLFVTRYDSTWHQPELVIDGDSAHVGKPTLISLSDGLVATWIRRGAGAVEWGALSHAGPLVTLPRGAVLFPGILEYEVVKLDGTSLLWYSQPRSSGPHDTVLAVLRRGGRTFRLNAFAVRNEAFLGEAVALSPTDLMMFTTQMPGPVAPTSMHTIVTRLTITCSL